MLDKPWFVVVNPAAGNGLAGKRWPLMAEQLKAHFSALTIVFSERRGHVGSLVAAAVANGCRHIIAVGGDGTHHEAINGIMRQEVVDSSQITYALLPVGTGNDWIRTHGIPQQTDTWLQMMRAGCTGLQDIGLVSYQKEGAPMTAYFANVAGMAYDGFVVKFAERNKKWVFNRFFYLLMILRCLFLYRLQHLRISFEQHTVEDFCYTVNVGICRYSGGGMQLTPHAVPDDGLLALTIAGPVSKLGVLLNTYRFYKGTIAMHPLVSTYQVPALHVDTTSEAPLLIEADGEFLGTGPASFSILPKALRIVVPE